MTDNEFMEFDRIQKVQSVFRQYGQENFYISYSGGKDSNILSKLIDLAAPGNRISRVYSNTGIELNAVREFVEDQMKIDSRIHMIAPQKNIKQVLEEFGYPFKSKEHAAKVNAYQKNGIKPWVQWYIDGVQKNGQKSRYGCPSSLLFQFTEENKLKISDKCCEKIKEEPLKTWQKKMNIPYSIVGIRRSEGGRRNRAVCLAFQKDKLKSFHPLAPVSEEWEQYMIDKYDIKLPIVYYPPFNFERTGCKGCPFNINIQDELDIIEYYFPKERKQCEYIWKPVYDEYRRLGYRLKGDKKK